MKYAIILVGFQRFDKGTHVTILGKSKFVLLLDEIHNDVFRFMECRNFRLPSHFSLFLIGQGFSP